MQVLEVPASQSGDPDIVNATLLLCQDMSAMSASAVRYTLWALATGNMCGAKTTCMRMVCALCWDEMWAP